MSVDVSVMIVSWNPSEVLPGCLDSLPASAGGLQVETWVVDNGSIDGTPEAIRRNYPNVRLLENTENVGFAAANNQAATQATGRYLLMLNPDTQAAPRALETLVRYADAHPCFGAVGPKLLNPDGSQQRSCWRGYPGLGMALTDALYLWKVPGLPLAKQSEYNAEELTGPLEVDHILGAAMLIRRAAWQQVGELDPSFFLFLEETDWCYRARRLGWRMAYTPEAVVTHLGEHSVHQNPERNLPLFYRNYCRFYRTHLARGKAGPLVLKGIIGLAAAVRVGLWQWRQARRKGSAQVRARRMGAGYRLVLSQLATF